MIHTTKTTNWVLLGCTAFLAAEPAVWLVRTWLDASWNSSGEFAFVAVLGLFVWSATSRRQQPERNAVPALLFALTALVRVVGHVLAVNVIGALALVVDVFALGLLFGLHRRVRAVSPFWLAGLFAMTLPLERIIQRVVGFGLQQISAAGACGALSLGFDDVACAGVDILLRGEHVLVDLPCSGARGLLLLCGAYLGLATVVRPTLPAALAGIATTLLSALVSNTARIALLAIGIAYRDVVGFDVMAQPWHDIVGLGALALGLAPVVVWARLAASIQCAPVAAVHDENRASSPGAIVALVAACLAVALTPHSPVDVARPIASLSTPQHLVGMAAVNLPLSERERAYFTQYGGAAAKSRYGERTLLLVRTSAPLRHLHAPDECLVGAGFDVERLGITHGEMPGATYRAVAPDGSQWRVVVTYRSDAGELATSISQAVWLWLQNPQTTWTAIERIHPWNAPTMQNDAFDRALIPFIEAQHKEKS